MTMMKVDALKIAHLSDLHLTATDDGRRKEDRARNMNANLCRLLHHAPIQEAELVAVTGDVSDRGELAAWNVLWAAVKDASIPGNRPLAPKSGTLFEQSKSIAAASVAQTR